MSSWLWNAKARSYLTLPWRALEGEGKSTLDNALLLQLLDLSRIIAELAA